MNKSRLYNIILKPIMSEKTMRSAETNKQFVFKVAKNATKQEVKQAVETLFGVTVKGVNTTNLRGKNKSFRQVVGKRSDSKKAYVALAEGQDIEFATGE